MTHLMGSYHIFRGPSGTKKNLRYYEHTVTCSPKRAFLDLTKQQFIILNLQLFSVR